MSYDLMFARLADRQTWDDYLDADEDDDDSEDVDAEIWARIVRRVRAVLPNLVDHGGELDDEQTAIQVFCSADSAAIQVPYWHTGAAAHLVVTTMYRISAIIEEETGLQGYDPQIEVPTAEAGARVADAVAVFEMVAASFSARAITTDLPTRGGTATQQS
ncbi:hypothetical protein GCM10009682_16840 [Luedemannella flava]|uniref:Uncharacterized protein n=1 Tax=Luedemannella flava TaxID=349316 RepID=A0ABP4XYU7_9ACTN